MRSLWPLTLEIKSIHAWVPVDVCAKFEESSWSHPWYITVCSLEWEAQTHVGARTNFEAPTGSTWWYSNWISFFPTPTTNFCHESRYYWTLVHCMWFTSYSFLRRDIDRLHVHISVWCIFFHNSNLSGWTWRFFLDEREEGKSFLKL